MDAIDLLPLSVGVCINYRFWGVPVELIDTGTPLIAKIALGILGGQYINVFVHEMGHVLAHYAITGRIGRISLLSNGNGYVRFDQWKYIYPSLTHTQEVIRSFAGPFAAIVFSVARSLGIYHCETWFKRRQNGEIGRYQSALLTLLKVHNAITVFTAWAQPLTLLMNHDIGSDYIDIYQNGGISVTIGSIALIGVIGALAIKIMRNDIPVQQPLSSKVYNSIKTTIERARKATYEVNLIAMGVMKSAIDLVGSPLVVQMNAKRLGTPKRS